jgi:Ca2+-binding RTX toxin-like protein
MTGGYTLDVEKIDPATRDPLESLDWDTAANVPFVNVNGVKTAYVYFAPAGENFGEKADDGVTPMTTYGWEAHQSAAVMSALEHYERILGVNYEVTTDSSKATFRLMTTNSTEYGAYFYPQDPDYGTQKGIGVFNLQSGGFGTRPESLKQGGFSYAVILHEFGHAHGIAHPHDSGGDSEVMLGVTDATGSYGVYNLNQGVYTVMSYNDAWDFHPDGPTTEHPEGRIGAVIDRGWSGGLSAFDVAILQKRYGVSAYNEGNNNYVLNDNYKEAFYQTIWDSAGNDTISYGGALDAQIDLTAATLDYTPTGGGVISFLYNSAQPDYTTEIKGGYTIANGVVIENATGGSGNDALIGNSANNVLTGNAGNDVLVGRAGNDILRGGAGNDILIGGDGLDVATLGAGNDAFVLEPATSTVKLKTGTMAVDIITDFDGLGDDVIDLAAFGIDFAFRGTSANKAAGDLTYKTYGNINAAENVLGFDIDGVPGAAGVSGPVTVVYGNIDGGAIDFALILLKSNNVSADDFGAAAVGNTRASYADYYMV